MQAATIAANRLHRDGVPATRCTSEAVGALAPKRSGPATGRPSHVPTRSG